jgi:hypothetical protein
MISEIVNSLFLTYLASEYLIEQDGRGTMKILPTGVMRINNNNNNSNNNHIRNHDDGGESLSSSSLSSKRRLVGMLAILVLIVNVMDHVVGITDRIHGVLEWISDDGRNNVLLSYMAIPLRAAIAATSYTLALYCDVNRRYVLGRLFLLFLYCRRQGNERIGSTQQLSSSSSFSLLTANDSRSTSDSTTATMNKNIHNPIPFGSVFLPYVGRAFVRILPAYPFMAVMISFGFMFIINIWEFFHLPLEWLNSPIYYGTLYGPFGWIYIHVKKHVQQKAMTLPS